MSERTEPKRDPGADANDREALAQVIFDTSIDSIITIDPRGIIETVNRAAIQAFGYAESDMVGRNVSMLMPEPYARQHDDYLARYLATGVARIIGIGREVECRRKDGTIFPGDLAVTRAQVGGRTIFVGSIRDQTERRTAERRVMAAEQLAAVGTLVAGLAHEIGTPMGVIQGHARLLEKAVQGEKAKWRLTTIQEQIARISRIIQSLLNMARPKATERVEVDLGSLLETTLSFLQEKLHRNRVRVIRDLAPTPSITGDPERLQQLLLNLFLNAVDAMQDGGELRIRLAPNGSGGASIWIGDTGVGIPANELDRIFDAFHTTKEAGKGNGLGLTVARRIVADHHGTLAVESVVGEGTEFQIQLPKSPA